MNQLASLAAMAATSPDVDLSKMVGQVVPFVGTAGIHFEKMTNDLVVLTLENKQDVRNHIGQVHAAAMMLLIETATGMVTGMNVPDGRIPLLKSMQTKFIKRSTGALRAEASLSAEQITHIVASPKGEVTVPFKVIDEAGNEPVIGEAIWAWITPESK